MNIEWSESDHKGCYQKLWEEVTVWPCCGFPRAIKLDFGFVVVAKFEPWKIKVFLN